MFQTRTWVCALAVTLLAGCRESGVQDCQDLIGKARYEHAVKRCAEVYAAEGDAHAGAATVLAHYSLGHGDEVLAWVDRLAKDGKVRPGVWGLAAAVHLQRGEAEAADREYRSDLALYQAMGNHARAADTLIRLAGLAEQRSRYREEFLLYRRALEEAVTAKDRDLEEISARGLYNVLYSVGDLQGARQALERASELAGEQDPGGQAWILANRGNVLADEGRLALARRDYEGALALGTEGTERVFFRSAHLNLTKVHLRLGEAARAAHHLEAAWKYAEPGEPIPSSLLYYRARVALAQGRPADAVQALTTALSQDPAPDWAWDLEYQRGRAEEARGELKAAEAAYEKSIEIVEEMRRSLAFDELKTWLLDRKREPFEALFRLQARSGRAEEALATAEKAQARTLLDALLHAHSAEGLARGASWSPDVAAARIADLELLLPVMSESPVAVLQPVERVLRAFGDRHGLVYFEAGDEVWLATVTRRKVRLRPLTLPAAGIRRLAERFLAHPEDAGAAGELGEALLPPEALPERGKTVYVVADGVLGNLPFAALRREGRYLVEDHPVALVPSLNALAALESRDVEVPGPPLVLADPRGNLPAAALEGRAVAKLLSASLRTAGTATSRELEGAARARILHLATHTGLSARGPWLLLADRRLGASEIVTHRIGPRLVVLASCASGVRPGRQMWGSMGAAFLAAGSRAVLASLWSVEARQTHE
ncbi:MAG TPA: CHAT domain-containing protein, partial [Thermoanaerobaculia bacterium]|nr:CHAT domain-containing protein [Thermoanaerobaculia bacterium]